MPPQRFVTPQLRSLIEKLVSVAFLFIAMGCIATAGQAEACALSLIRLNPSPPVGLIAGTFAESSGSVYLFNASVVSYASVQQLTWAPLLGAPEDLRIVDGMDARFKDVSALVVDDGGLPTLLVFDDSTLRTIDLLLRNTSTWYGEPGESAVVDGYAPAARVLAKGFGAASLRQGRLFFSAAGSHCVRLWKYAIEIFPGQFTVDPSPQYFLSTVAGNCTHRGQMPLGTSTAAAARFDSIHSLAVSEGSATPSIYVADAVGLHRFTVKGTVATIFVPGWPTFPIGSLVFNLVAIQTVLEGDVLFTIGLPAAQANRSCGMYRYRVTSNEFLEEPIVFNLSVTALPNSTCGDLRLMPRPAKNFTYLAVGNGLFRLAQCDAIPIDISTPETSTPENSTSTSTPVPTAVITSSPLEPTSNSTSEKKRNAVGLAVGISLGGFAVVLLLLGVLFRLHTSDRFIVRSQRSLRSRPSPDPPITSTSTVVAVESSGVAAAVPTPSRAVASDDELRPARLSPSPNEPAYSAFHYDPTHLPPQSFRITASEASNDSHVPVSPRAAWEQNAHHEARQSPPPLYGFSCATFISGSFDQVENDRGESRPVGEQKSVPTPPQPSPLMQSSDSADVGGRNGSASSRNIHLLSAELAEHPDFVNNDGAAPVTPVAKDLLCQSGHLHRLKLIGRGSSGSVYAVLLADGSTVAMKEMLLTLPGEDFARQLAEVQREIFVMSQLDHPRIVKYYHSKADLREMKVNIFMELVTGGSLTKMARDVEGPIAESLLRRYIRQTVDGLAFIHSKGIVHRDLKGENLLLTGEGSVKIADFGTARVLCPQSNLAQTMIGTPMFMAPEILSDLTEETGETDANFGYGAKADIWSLGITVCELANRGQPPWPSFSSPGQAFAYIANPANSPTVPSYLSDTAKDFVRRCCTRDPTRRPSAEELKEHPWIRAKGKSSSDASLESSLGSS